MPLTDLTANTLNTLEPQRSCNVVLSITPYGQFSESGNVDLIRIGLDSGALPSWTIDARPVGYGNTRRNYMGAVSVEPFSINVKELIDVNDNSRASVQLLRWWNEHYNWGNGTPGFPSIYKRNAMCVWYSSKGTQDLTIALTGVWMSDLSLGDFSKEDDNPIVSSVTFQVDAVAYVNYGSTHLFND